MHMHPHMHPHTLSYTHIITYQCYTVSLGMMGHGCMLGMRLPGCFESRTACSLPATEKRTESWFLIFMRFHEPQNSPVPSLSEANSQTRSLSKRQLTDGAKLRMCDGPFDVIRLSFKVLQTDLSRVNDEPARWSELYACFLDLFGPKAAYSVVIVVRMNDIPFGLGYLKIRCVFLDQ